MNVVRRIAACAALVAACAAPPSPSAAPPSAVPDPVSGTFLALAGDRGAETLTAIEAATGETRPVDLPPGGARGLASGWAPVVAVVADRGSVVVGRPVGPAVAWERLEVAVGDAVGAAVSPDGRQLAVTIMAPERRRPFEFVLLDLAGRSTHRVEVDADLDGLPFWVDGSTVGVPTTDGDRREYLMIGTGADPVRRQRTALADLSRSADGTRFADGWGVYDRSIFEAVPGPPIAETGIEAYASAALDRSGRVLAVVLSDDDGEATAIVVHAQARGWNEVARFAVRGGAKRAFVTWMP